MSTVVSLVDAGVQGERVKRRRRRFKKVPTLVGTQQRRAFWLYKSATFDITAGECVFLLDPTEERAHALMRTMCGLLPVDVGTVTAARRAVLLARPHRKAVGSLSVGQAVRLLAGLYGMRDREVDDLFDEAVEFAGVRRRLSKPVDEVDGDLIRQVAFAVATAAPVDLLALDGMAIVGEPEFRATCVPRLRQLMADGRALVVLSDDPVLIETLGTRALQVERNKITELTPEQAAEIARGSAHDRRQQRRRRRRAAHEDEDDDIF